IQVVKNGAILRFLKNLANIAEEVLSGQMGIRSNHTICQRPTTIEFGKVYIIDNVDNLRKRAEDSYFLCSPQRNLFFEITQSEDKIIVDTFMSPYFLLPPFLHPMEIGPWQENIIRETLLNGYIETGENIPLIANPDSREQHSDTGKARVLLMPSGGTPSHDSTVERTQYEVGVLRENLLNAGVDVVGFFQTIEGIIRSEHEDYLNISQIFAENPNIIILHMSQYDYSPSKIAERIRAIRSAGIDAYIVIEGLGTSYLPEQQLVLTDADVLIRGEGNVELPKLIEILGGSRPSQGLTDDQIKRLHTINGLYFRTKETVLVNNLDVVNFTPVDKLTLPTHRYTPNIDVYPSFGCPFACPFCHLGMVFDHRIRRIPAQKVVNWLQELSERVPKGTVINIWDENFLFHRRWVVEFASLLQEAGLADFFEFNINQSSIDTLVRNGRVDTELIEILKNIGVRHIGFGTDGLTDKALAFLKVNNQGRQRYTISDVLLLEEALKNAGIDTLHMLILTNPETTLKDLVESVLNWVILPINWVRKGEFSFTTFPTFGTKLYHDYIHSHSSSVDLETITWRSSTTDLVATWNGKWVMDPAFPEFGIFDPWQFYNPPEHYNVYNNPYLDYDTVMEAINHPIEFLYEHPDILEEVLENENVEYYEQKVRFFQILKEEGIDAAKSYLPSVNGGRYPW
ncbi:MAG: hypothetical protein DRP73_05080, partial [Candidatus Omnitrophota bacterium]